MYIYKKKTEKHAKWALRSKGFYFVFRFNESPFHGRAINLNFRRLVVVRCGFTAQSLAAILAQCICVFVSHLTFVAGHSVFQPLQSAVLFGPENVRSFDQDGV